MAEPESGAPRALLLTAGLGTRLHPLTYRRAKAAVPINGEPLVNRIIRWLSTTGIRDLVLNLHHHPASIAAVVGDGSGLGVRVRYSWEQPVLGSAGGPRHALPLLADDSDETFLIVNGDTLTNLDVHDVLARHRESSALVTMALIENPRPDFYGGVRVSDDGWVTGFAPRGHQGRSYHFIGVQAVRARVFADLEDGVPFESVNALYPRLIAQNPRAIAAHISNTSFLDIGTPRDCLDTSLLLARREGARLVGERTSVASSAVLTDTVLWDDVTVGQGAELRECIVADGATIPHGARFARCSIVLADGRTPAAAERIEGSLLISPFVREKPEAP
jgi:NDP-sugar pyrophosphorylase family protein